MVVRGCRVVRQTAQRTTRSLVRQLVSSGRRPHLLPALLRTYAMHLWLQVGRTRWAPPIPHGLCHYMCDTRLGSPSDASPLRIMLAHCAGFEHLNIIGHWASFGFDPPLVAAPRLKASSNLFAASAVVWGCEPWNWIFLSSMGTTFLSPFPSSSMMPCASCPSAPSLRVP